MNKQKFHKGDLVRLADDFGKWMAHFPGAGGRAIVVGSYADKYGGFDTSSYTLYVENHGETSWYCDDQMTLIETNRLDLLSEWQEKMEREIKERSDLDWIFLHGEEMLKDRFYGASIMALAECLGIDDLWGSKGEGFTFYMNALEVLGLAEPYLRTHDKEGWLMECDKFRLRSPEMAQDE